MIPAGKPARVWHHEVFACLLILGAAVLYRPLSLLIRSSLVNDGHSAVLFVLPICLGLLFSERHGIFCDIRYSTFWGALLLVVGGLILIRMRLDSLDQEARLSLSIFLFALWAITAFAFSYGSVAVRTAKFPLALILLITPLPTKALNFVIAFLQQGSALATSWLFSLGGIPFIRQELVFALPKFDIEIAKECSGIRSSLILLICGLVLGHLFLKSPWTKLTLTLAVVPFTIAKNGLRIFTLAALGTYFSPAFLFGKLHRDGGIIYFILALAALFGLAKLLRRGERRGHPGIPVNTPAAVAAKNVG